MLPVYAPAQFACTIVVFRPCHSRLGASPVLDERHEPLSQARPAGCSNQMRCEYTKREVSGQAGLAYICVVTQSVVVPMVCYGTQWSSVSMVRGQLVQPMSSWYQKHTKVIEF